MPSEPTGADADLKCATDLAMDSIFALEAATLNWFPPKDADLIFLPNSGLSAVKPFLTVALNSCRSLLGLYHTFTTGSLLAAYASASGDITKFAIKAALTVALAPITPSLPVNDVLHCVKPAISVD